jgi:hypothetical protein
VKRIILIAFFCTIFNNVQAQYGRGDFNHIGISGGVTQMSLFTDNFSTSPAMGWVGGLSVRGNYYNNFAMEFGMQFTESKFKLTTLNGLTPKDVDMKIMAVQVNLLLCYKIAGSNFSLDVGPVLQVNSKLKFDGADGNNSIAEIPALRMKDIEEVTTINANIKGGISGGFDNLRVGVYYQYGLTNFLNNLNKQDEIKAITSEKLKGHLGIISAHVVVYL